MRSERSISTFFTCGAARVISSSSPWRSAASGSFGQEADQEIGFPAEAGPLRLTRSVP